MTAEEVRELMGELRGMQKGYSRRYALYLREDRVWEALEQLESFVLPVTVDAAPCTACGRDLHGYCGPLCRYCDPDAACE